MCISGSRPGEVWVRANGTTGGGGGGGEWGSVGWRGEKRGEGGLEYVFLSVCLGIVCMYSCLSVLPVIYLSVYLLTVLFADSVFYICFCFCLYIFKQLDHLN